MMTELEAIHDGRRSFYNKAYVCSENDKHELYSYGVHVVTIKGDKFKFHADANYSDTTRRHVREFMIQYFGNTEFLSKHMIEDLIDGEWHKGYHDDSNES